MEHKFKVGDKCTVTRMELLDDIVVGEVIEIVYIDATDDDYPYRDSKHNWFAEENLELVDAEDPVRMDFALFGLGAIEGF